MLPVFLQCCIFFLLTIFFIWYLQRRYLCKNVSIVCWCRVYFHVNHLISNVKSNVLIFIGFDWIFIVLNNRPTFRDFQLTHFVSVMILKTRRKKAKLDKTALAREQYWQHAANNEIIRWIHYKNHFWKHRFKMQTCGWNWYRIKCEKKENFKLNFTQK